MKRPGPSLGKSKQGAKPEKSSPRSAMTQFLGCYGANISGSCSFNYFFANPFAICKKILQGCYAAFAAIGLGKRAKFQQRRQNLASSRQSFSGLKGFGMADRWERLLDWSAPAAALAGSKLTLLRLEGKHID